MLDLFPARPRTLSLFETSPPPIVRVIDTETAGHRLEDDAVIEIGSVDLDLATGAITNPMQSLASPGAVAINPHARRVHRITDEMLVGAPSFADAVAPFTGATFYAAQRAEFDRPRLKITGRWLCTHKIALRAFPGVRSHGLQSLVKQVPLDLSGVRDLLDGSHAHRALYDAACTAILLRTSLEALAGRCANVDDFLERAEAVSREPALLVRLRFGKHKETPIRDVPTDYLEWLERQPNMDGDVRFTVRHHLRVRRQTALARFTRGEAVAV